MGENVQRYKILEDRISQLHTGIGHLKKDVTTKGAEFKQLSSYLQGWKFQNPFPVIESDINGMIGKWQHDAPLNQLSTKLSDYYSKIEHVDKVLQDLKKHLQKLKNNPDRHNCKAAIDKITLFQQKVHDIPLSQIDAICKEIIPKLYSMIDSVYSGFNDEEEKVKKNQETAKKLNSLIDSYDGYVDRFNLRQLSEKCRMLTAQVLKNPNKADPDADTTRLQKASQALDNCMDQFKLENERYRTIFRALNDNRKDIWIDDYDMLAVILEKDAYHDVTSSDHIQKQYDGIVGLKKSEINQAISTYSQKYKDYFSDEIQKLRDGLYGRKDLRSLIAKIDRKVAEDKKQLMMKILKYSGIAIAVGLAIWAIFIWWQWILVIVIVLGLIAYFLDR